MLTIARWCWSLTRFLTAIDRSRYALADHIIDLYRAAHNRAEGSVDRVIEPIGEPVTSIIIAHADDVTFVLNL